MANTNNTEGSGDIAGLLKRINELEEEKARHVADLETSETVIRELKAELEAAQKKATERSASGSPQVKVGKTTYDIVIPKFRYGGENKTAEDVQKDNKLAAELVKAGSGVLLEHKE